MYGYARNISIHKLQQAKIFFIRGQLSCGSESFKLGETWGEFLPTRMSSSCLFINISLWYMLGGKQGNQYSSF